MIRGNNINRFLRGCSDHRDQLFCLFELKKLPWPYGWSLGWKRFFRWGLTVPQPLFWYFSMGSRRKTKHANIHLDHSSVINLSSCSLSTDEISILSRGLTFVPVRGLCKVRMRTADADGGRGRRTADGGRRTDKKRETKK